MFLKYLKRKSFIHLFPFYIFKFLKRKSFIHLFTFYTFYAFLNFSIKKKRNSEIPLIASYTLLLSFFNYRNLFLSSQSFFYYYNLYENKPKYEFHHLIHIIYHQSMIMIFYQFPRFLFYAF